MKARYPDGKQAFRGLACNFEEMNMREQTNQQKPGKSSNETHYQEEREGKQGTMGGQTPLHAPAGVQKPGPGGVLTEEGKIKKDQ